jgi:hypothetical protein
MYSKNYEKVYNTYWWTQWPIVALLDFTRKKKLQREQNRWIKSLFLNVLRSRLTTVWRMHSQTKSELSAGHKKGFCWKRLWANVQIVQASADGANPMQWDAQVRDDGNEADLRDICARFTPDARVTSANPTQCCAHLPHEERATFADMTRASGVI